MHKSICIGFSIVFSVYAATEKKDSASAGAKKIDTVVVEIMAVTARGYKKPVSSTPGGVSVVDAKAIENSNVVSITNLAEQVPGAVKCSDGAWGAEISIRGLDRDRVAMLIDNVSINTASALGFKFGTIDPVWVERMEVLKGPVSSICGSGSFGGAINVITRKGYFSKIPKFDARFSLGYGSNGFSKRLFGYGAYNSPRFYASVGMSGRNQDLYSDGSGNTVRSTQFSDAEGKINLGVKLSDSKRIEMAFDYFRGENIGMPGGSGSMPGSPVGKPDIAYKPCSRMLIDASYTYTPKNSWLKEFKFDLNYVNLYRLVYFNTFPKKSDYPVGTPPSLLGSTFMDSIKAYTRHPGYSLKSYIILVPINHKIVTGVDALVRTSDQGRERWFNANPPASTGNRYNYINDAPFPDIFFLTGGIFAEDNWNICDYFGINYGGRVDGLYVKNKPDSLFHENKNNPTTNKLLWEEKSSKEAYWDAHLGLTVKIAEGLKVTRLLSRGYRPASMEERYRYVDLGSKKQYGNPDLRPEKSIFNELGIHYDHRVVSASFSLYYNYVQDLIQPGATTTILVDSIAQSGETLINVGKARLNGLELETSVKPIYWLTILGSLSYIKGKDITGSDTVMPLPGIPPLNGTAGIKLNSKYGVWFSFTGVATAPALPEDIPGGVPFVKEWERFDCRLGYGFTTVKVKHNLYIGADNIGNKQYRNYLSTSRGLIVNEPGFSFVAGYTLVF
jgi:hemoglobin/transferrin/lactoferrin receptor protein